MRTAGSVDEMRRTISFLSGAPLSMSKRTLLLRVAASGPWHVKHLSERIGRISRLNTTGWAETAAGHSRATAQTTAICNSPGKYLYLIVNGGLRVSAYGIGFVWNSRNFDDCGVRLGIVFRV